jgi:hypothetical protein
MVRSIKDIAVVCNVGRGDSTGNLNKRAGAGPVEEVIVKPIRAGYQSRRYVQDQMGDCFRRLLYAKNPSALAGPVDLNGAPALDS